ncbi:MAG: hypothetical protein ACLGI6_16760 [Gammaproteobacteria bacterium]
MSSTLPRRLCATLLLAAVGAGAGAAESNQRPRYVQEPILGLRLPAAGAQLDVLPDDVRALCVQMADNESWSGRQWIFGMARSATSTYYLVNGYFKRRSPEAGEGLYFQPEDGGLYQVSGSACNGDPAREAFAVNDPAQVPGEVMQQLAHDLARRLVRALGGADRLRAAIARQRIDLRRLSPELQEAFKPYVR